MMYFLSGVRNFSKNGLKASLKFVVSSSNNQYKLTRCDVIVYLANSLVCKRTFSSLRRNVAVLICGKELGIRINEKHLFLDSKRRRMISIANNSNLTSALRLGDYDCIGFDLDNTLCEYHLSSSIEMEYKVLSNFLVKEKGYDPDYLLKPMDKEAVDFLHKGLLVDFARGNLLKVGENGYICKVSHGTKFLTEKEILDAYGNERKWEVTSEFCKNPLSTWNGPLAEKMRPLLDYFDMPASLAFARIVDSLDHKLGKPADVYNIWPDILTGLHKMYSRDNFSNDEGEYFLEIKNNPTKYIKKCNPLVIEWLKKIQDSKVTFLITGSNCDFASLTAETCLGKDWRSFFDVIICYARKPGFFSGCRPFVELNGFKEMNPIHGDSLEFGKIYSQGNWQELYNLFIRKLDKKEPKCLYFGDNLIQDVYAPSEYTRCDTAAVVEELQSESRPISQLGLGL